MDLERAKELRVGDEVLLRNGNRMVITYMNMGIVEGFNDRGWMTSPTLSSIVKKTGRHFDLPITKE